MSKTVYITFATKDIAKARAFYTRRGFTDLDGHRLDAVFVAGPAG